MLIAPPFRVTKTTFHNLLIRMGRLQDFQGPVQNGNGGPCSHMIKKFKLVTAEH